MTQARALSLCRALRKSSELTEDIFARFLSEAEGFVQKEIHGNLDWVDDGQLSAPHPYDRLYWLYVIAMTDLVTGDLSSYRSTVAEYEKAYREYGNYCMQKRTVG